MAVSTASILCVMVEFVFFLSVQWQMDVGKYVPGRSWTDMEVGNTQNGTVVTELQKHSLITQQCINSYW